MAKNNNSTEATNSEANAPEVEVPEITEAAFKESLPQGVSLEMLDMLSSTAFAINAQALALRAEISAASQSKAERRTALLSDKDDKEIQAGVSFIADLKKSLAEAEKNLSDLVETRLSEQTPDEDSVERKKTYREMVEKAVGGIDAFTRTVSNIIGEDGVSDYLNLREYEPAGALRKSSGNGNRTTGTRRPRFSEVRIDGELVVNAEGKSNLTAAATFLKKKGAKEATAGTLLAAFSEDQETIDTLKTEEGSWNYSYTLGEKSHTVTITTVPVVSEIDDEDETDTDD